MATVIWAGVAASKFAVTVPAAEANISVEELVGSRMTISGVELDQLTNLYPARACATIGIQVFDGAFLVPIGGTFNVLLQRSPESAGETAIVISTVPTSVKFAVNVASPVSRM